MDIKDMFDIENETYEVFDPEEANYCVMFRETCGNHAAFKRYYHVPLALGVGTIFAYIARYTPEMIAPDIAVTPYRVINGKVFGRI